MSTLRQIVSDIRSREKLISYDNLITDRFIASEVKDAALLLVKRETDRRRLWNTDTLFTSIPCLQMQEVPLAECCDYTSSKTISRSVHQLPKIAEGKYQYLISGVYNIEASQRLKYMPVNRYINILKLKNLKEEVYFWIQNRYLYATSPDIKALRLSFFSLEDIPFDLYNDCNCKGENPCINPLDRDFNIPDYLVSTLKNQVTDILLNSYHRLHGDNTSNDKPDNEN